MNFSVWDSKRTKPRLRPSFVPSEVVVEFERTKRAKVVKHVLGEISFSDVVDLNPGRQEIIDSELDNLTSEGFRFSRVGNVFSKPELTGKNPGEETYNIYSHGVPSQDRENCLALKLECAEGFGSSSQCLPGKCIIGTVSRVSDTKWEYVSATEFGSERLRYFFPAGRVAQLKSVLRGEVNGVKVTSPASVACTIYLPPKFYSKENFVDVVIKRIDERLELVTDKPFSSVVGYESVKEAFIQKITTLALSYPSEGAINQELYSVPSQAVVDALLSVFQDLESPWLSIIEELIETNRELFKFSTNFELIRSVYEELFQTFDYIIQSIPSSVVKASYDYGKDLTARPVYSRLPGLAEAYRSDPAFSDTEPPAQWLVSGVDGFLAQKKDSIAEFYNSYLNPDSCSPLVLDWLAQHIGLTGRLWDVEWEREIKVGMIKNAFGWWDRELFEDGFANGEEISTVTPKGVVLEEFPFTEPVWTIDPSEDNSLSVVMSEPRDIILSDTGEVIGDGPFSSKSFNSDTGLVELGEVGSVKFYKGLWNGLIEAKGSMLASVFLCSLFGLKAHTARELERVEQENGTFVLRPKSGLREVEIDAPTLLPVKYDVPQVGGEMDAKINNYSNQLVAGVSRFVSIEGSKNIFFRLPFYYNRGGRSWKKVEYITESWLPSNLNARVQHPYLAAGLWSVGDAFFKPELVGGPNPDPDPDPELPELSISTQVSSEFEQSPGITITFFFDISREGNLDIGSSVEWRVVGHGPNPANEADFADGVYPSGQVSFAPGESVKNLTVNIAGDDELETDEQFKIELLNPTSAIITTQFVIMTILTDEPVRRLYGTGTQWGSSPGCSIIPFGTTEIPTFNPVSGDPRGFGAWRFDCILEGTTNEDLGLLSTNPCGPVFTIFAYQSSLFLQSILVIRSYDVRLDSILGEETITITTASEVSSFTAPAGVGDSALIFSMVGVNYGPPVGIGVRLDILQGGSLLGSFDNLVSWEVEEANQL